MMQPLGDRPTSQDLFKMGGPSEETTLLKALRGSLPEEVSSEQIKKIATAVMTKFPGIASSVVSGIVPLVVQNLYTKGAEGEPTVEQQGTEFFVAAVATLLCSFIISSQLKHRVVGLPIENEPRTEQQQRAVRNWEIGSLFGNISLAAQQLFSTSTNYGTALGMVLAFIGLGAMDLKEEEKVKIVKPNKQIQMMADTIRTAIESGLLDFEDVTTYSALSATQNLIILSALNQLSTDKFCRRFSKLIDQQPLRGAPVNRGDINNLQEQLRELSDHDKMILVKKLSLSEETEEKPDKPGVVADLFKKISAISMDVSVRYQDEVKASIESQLPKSFSSLLYDRFLEFLSKS